MIVVTVARRPLSQSTIGQNALAYGTGAVHVDGTRVSASDPFGGGWAGTSGFAEGYAGGDGWVAGSSLGRWPANLVLEHKVGCVQVGERSVRTSTATNKSGTSSGMFGGIGAFAPSSETRGYARQDGTETVASWNCEPGCPVADLDAQSGDCPVSGAARNHKPVTGDFDGGMFGSIGSRGTGAMHDDAGGASRFFKQVKP